MYEITIKHILLILFGSGGGVLYLVKFFMNKKMKKFSKETQEKIDIKLKETQEKIDIRLKQFSEMLKEKREAYREYVGLYMDIINSERKLTIKEVKKRSYKFYGSLILYANPITFKVFIDFMQYLYNSENKFNMEALKLFGKLIFCMREEIGSSNKGLEETDILKGIMKDLEKNAN